MVLILAASSALAQTREFLRGTQVQSRVRVLWDTGMQRILAATDDDEQFRPLTAVQPFLTGQNLNLTYPRLNPLRIAAAAAPVGEPVAADAVTAQLRALVSMAFVSLPDRKVQVDPTRFLLFDVREPCPASTAARKDAEALLQAIIVTSSPPTVGALLSLWRQTIDDAFASGRSGTEAIGVVMLLMDSFVRDLDAVLSASTRVLAKIDSEVARPVADDPCARSTRTLYETLILTNPRARLAEFAAIRAAVTSLRDAINRQYVVAARWRGAEYLLANNIQPPRDELLATAIRVTDVRLDIDASSGAVVAIAETTTTETMTAQRHARFAREFAIASIVGTVTPERYGTATNASGTTVVGRTEEPIASFAAAFLVSFVCRCQTGPLIAPMLQIGITTSKDVPAILAGGGLRLFGLPRGDVALGMGAMIAWVKDLDSLRVGDPVGGTVDIETDLHYVRRQGFYIALQYKF